MKQTNILSHHRQPVPTKQNAFCAKTGRFKLAAMAVQKEKQLRYLNPTFSSSRLDLANKVTKDDKRTIIKKIDEPTRIRPGGSIALVAVRASAWKFIYMIMSFLAFGPGNLLLVLSVMYLNSVTAGGINHCDAQLGVLSTECTRSKASWGAPQCCQALSLCTIGDAGQQPCICEFLSDPWLFGFHFGEKERIQLLLTCGLPPKVNCGALSPPPPSTNTVSWTPKLDIIVGIMSGVSALIGITMWVTGVLGWLRQKCKDCWSREQMQEHSDAIELTQPTSNAHQIEENHVANHVIENGESIAEETDEAIL